MNKYYAYLSGAHPTLPRAELEASLWAEGVEYRVVAELDQLLILLAEPLRAAAERTGYLHEYGLLLGTCDQDLGELVTCAREADWAPLLHSYQAFYVKVSRVKGVARHIDAREAAKRVGAVIARGTGLRVDPRNGAKVHVILVEGVAVLGLALWEQRGGFEDRRPQRKPFFKPGALDPRLSRAFVNLSRVKRGGLYYDPFCGTGGFAVEAMSIGLTVLCSDLDRVMAEGSRRNLSHYSGLFHPVYDCIEADASNQPLRPGSVDGIGTDPPYGRSTTTKGRGVVEVLEGFLYSAAETVKPGGFIAFASPHWVLAEDIAVDAGLRVWETHYMRVHGTLTRKIVVAWRP